MQQTFQNLVKRTSWPGRLLLAAALLVVSFLGRVSLAGADDPPQPAVSFSLEEIEREIARMDARIAARQAEQGGALKVGGTISCGDDWCEGLYEDMVKYRYEREDGYSVLRVTPAVESYLAASSHNCASQQIIVLRNWDETSVNKNAVLSRWSSELSTAEVLGAEINLAWRQSNWSGSPVCNLNILYVLPVAS